MKRVFAKEFDWKRSGTTDKAVWQTAVDIVDAVRDGKDAALRGFIAKLDGVADATGEDFALRVPESRMRAAWEALDPSVQEALAAAADRIRRFHELQVPSDIVMDGADGERLGMTWRSLRRVGVYAPGGRAAYPSTVLMNIIPAKVAGVREIALASPAQRDTGFPHESVLAAAYLTGVKEVYRMGGAHAIAAFAYGTETIPAVDKVVGPGNAYVAMAKRAVTGDVGIDSVAGPSEVFIVADGTADVDYVAADMLAQAEHDVEAGAVCVTTSRAIADGLPDAIEKQLASLPTAAVARESIAKWGAIVVADSLDEAIDVVNRAAPEHVELLCEDPDAAFAKVQYAGAAFLGPFTPEPVGDYYAGTNHVLPTYGSARFSSGLGVGDFVKRMTYVKYDRDTLMKHANHIERLAHAEGFAAHASSVHIRVVKEGN